MQTAISQTPSKQSPKISVVTIVRNDPQGFLTTARSILKQDYPNIEWIVVDGLSDDGTSDYVRKLAPQIARFKIEKDTGIYNAMNKGIDMISGDWVFFMNADDVFFDQSTVSRYVEDLGVDDDILYADVIRREDRRIHSYRPPDQYWAGSTVDHQSACVRAKIYRELRYDESYRIAGDFDFFSRARVSKCHFRKIPGLIGCRKPFGSGASVDFFTRQAERVRVIRSYFLDSPWQAMLYKEYQAARASGVITDEELQRLNILIGG